MNDLLRTTLSDESCRQPQARPMTPRRLFLVLALIIWTAWPVAPARADSQPPCADEASAVRNMKSRDAALAYPKNPAAKRHLEAGKRAFGTQQYDKAIEEYMAAGMSDDAPLILYNLGQTYRAAKN